MYDTEALARTFEGRRVLVTGHTGFKGVWLGLVLERLGAVVSGLSLAPIGDSLYSTADLSGRWQEEFGDVRDRAQVQRVLERFDPDVVLHLAAQSLVSVGYQEPLQTMQTNVLGTANVLDAIGGRRAVRGCIVATTDKVYRPSTEGRRHREDDPLGGTDPYSASKVGAEQVVVAWRTVLGQDTQTDLSVVRAGNVIGGGDQAAGRLIPDLVRACMAGRPAQIRNPEHTRPWQHVLDPLYGYLLLGACMLRGEPTPHALNFGPAEEASVRKVADLVVRDWGDGASWVEVSPGTLLETEDLALDSSRARQAIGWVPKWSTEEAVRRTVNWWKSLRSGSSALDLCRRDIDAYLAR